MVEEEAGVGAWAQAAQDEAEWPEDLLLDQEGLVFVSILIANTKLATLPANLVISKSALNAVALW